MNPTILQLNPLVRPSRFPWWTILAIAPLVPLVLVGQAPWIVMWSTATTIWIGCKWAMFARADVTIVGWRRVAYWIAWPGMDPKPFVLQATGATRFEMREALVGIASLLAGGALLVAATHQLAEPFQAGWLGWTGIVLALHFGLFHLAAVGLRTAGIPVRPLMNNPLAARGLADFWGNRWNHAFQEIAHETLFKPVTRKVGASIATLAVFFVSGWLHELVITVPARAGFGGPTAYFVVQGLGLLFERTRLARAMGLRKTIVRRIWTYLVVLGPVPLLFPEAFLTRVITPTLANLFAP